MILPVPRPLRVVDGTYALTGRIVRSIFGVRLFYKILVANAALVALAVTGVAGALAGAPAGARAEIIGLAAMAGIVASVSVNGVILRLALRPLDRLQEAATRVGGGNLHARAPVSPLADPDLARLIETFNSTLDELTTYRLRLRSIAARAVEMAEEERKRIARDLHDDTAQTFAGLLIRLRAARGSASDEERTRLLDELRGELSDAVDRMRRFAQGLRPPALEVLGLRPAIEAHARRVAELDGLRIDVDVDRLEGALSTAAELALYRIVQEALSNVVRHARAGRVRIAVRRLDDHVVATIEDDGRGFDLDAVDKDPDRGLGIFGMEERASYIGGRVRVRSRPGVGTRVQAEIPARRDMSHV